MPVDTGCCAHDHDCDAADCGPAWSLHTHVAAGRVRALNAAAPARPAAVLRAWTERRADADPPLRSDDDDPPELLLHVPFDGLVRITVRKGGGGKGEGRRVRSLPLDLSTPSPPLPPFPLPPPPSPLPPPVQAISIVCNDADASPSTVRAFVNRDDADFDMVASVPPTQEWTLVPGPPGAAMEYPTKASKFQGVYSLDLHFPGNVGGGDVTRIDFVGIKGSHTPAKREAVVAVYEARPVPGDHKVREGGGG